MSDDELPPDDVDRLLDEIRLDWRRLGEASTDPERERIRREMQLKFDELRRRLDERP